MVEVDYRGPERKRMPRWLFWALLVVGLVFLTVVVFVVVMVVHVHSFGPFDG